MHSLQNRQVLPLEGFVVSALILSCPSPPSPPPDPSCSNALPKIKLCQSKKHYQAADITSFIFLAIHAVAPIYPPPPFFFPRSFLFKHPNENRNIPEK